MDQKKRLSTHPFCGLKSLTLPLLHPLNATDDTVTPTVRAPNQLVGAPLGTDVTIECHVESSPKSINYWMRDTGNGTTTRVLL